MRSWAKTKDRFRFRSLLASLGHRPNTRAFSVPIESERGSISCFDAFSSREPVSTPDQVRGRLSLENAQNQPSCQSRSGIGLDAIVSLKQTRGPTIDGSQVCQLDLSSVRSAPAAGNSPD